MAERLDVPDYQYLELFETGTEPDLVAAAVSRMVTSIPEWTPREGNTEMVLLEGLALMLGPEIMALKMVEYAMTERLMGLYGVERDPGLPATSRALFTVSASNPIQIIPAGTILRFHVAGTGETVDLATAEELRIVTTDGLTGSVAVSATDTGETGNGAAPGTELEIVGTLPFVDSAVLSETLAGGTDPEDDGSFMSRASALLARQVSTLVLPEHFQYAALSRAEVGRAKVLDLYDPANPTVSSPGHVSVAVAAVDGTVLSPEARGAIETALEADALASISVHAISPTYTTVDLAVTVRAAYGADPAAVEAAVEDSLRSWLSPATWDWSDSVGQYAIVSRVASVPGVAEVLSVPATVALPGAAPLPLAGTIAATVVS
ncbi:baseplate J protein [Arthrobacter phage Altadena]|uniref:Baseplate J protein n=1 Tax=Arthrobacter phage Altadena TaxID=3059064 RepID=A0AA96HT78_9CAUD|nr:baseplate J protein [Arthrobacter phage Altadena]